MRLHPVRDHQGRVHGEQRRQFGFVGLELLPRGPNGGVLIRRVLEFDHPKRQAIDEQHDIRSPFVMAFDDRELIDREPVVIGGNVEVDHAGLRPADGTVIGPILNRHTFHQHPVEAAIPCFQRRALNACQFAEGIFESLGRQILIQLDQRIPQPPFQDHLPVVGTLGSKRIGRNVRTMRNSPSEAFQPLKRGLLNFRFGDTSHGASLGLTTSKPSRSTTLRVATAKAWASAVPVTSRNLAMRQIIGS